MLFWITAVLALYVVHLFTPSLFRVMQPDIGVIRYVGSRDALPPLSPIGGRSERAAHNLAESLPFFLTAAILTVALDRESGTGILGAQIFFWARVAYLGLYLAAAPGCARSCGRWASSESWSWPCRCLTARWRPRSWS